MRGCLWTFRTASCSGTGHRLSSWQTSISVQDHGKTSFPRTRYLPSRQFHSQAGGGWHLPHRHSGAPETSYETEVSFIVFPEMNTFSIIKQILLYRTPYGRSNLLGCHGINVLLIPVLLHGNIRMQLVFTEPITSADIGKPLIDAVLIFLGKIIFSAGCK